MPSLAPQLIEPQIQPPLDPAFRPAVLAHHEFVKQARLSSGDPVRLALEQTDGSISAWNTVVFPKAHPSAEGNFRSLERLTKFLLWARGGFRIFYSGPPELGEQLQRYYRESP